MHQQTRYLAREEVGRHNLRVLNYVNMSKVIILFYCIVILQEYEKGGGEWKLI